MNTQKLDHMRTTYNNIAAAYEGADEATKAALTDYMTANAQTLFAEYARLDARRAAIIESNRNPRAHECTRCNGRGYFKGYSHVQGGVCFKCGGTGKR